ncbi:MAG: methylmalonyl-CoA mutase family protein [Dermatophilaceae bacterium]
MCKTVDPFAGSYVIEAMTDELETAIDRAHPGRRGPAAAPSRAIEQGFQKQRDRAVGIPRGS